MSNGASQVYNNADKIFHLHRDLPIAAMTWGLGSIGSASISTLAKDLRRRLMGGDEDHLDWKLEDDTWTIESITERLVEMFYDELFLTEFPDAQHPPPGPLGMLVVGYSPGQRQAEGWQVFIETPIARPVPKQIIDIPGYGWVAFAQPEATERLFYGIDQVLVRQIEAAVDAAAWTAIQPLLLSAQRSPVLSSMPFADAIGLARFLVETTARYSHFLPGPDTVGGVVEVAGINRHEGFRWISRKHYYSPELNPWGRDHD
jgi:hypothetical protein